MGGGADGAGADASVMGGTGGTSAEVGAAGANMSGTEGWGVAGAWGAVKATGAAGAATSGASGAGGCGSDFGQIGAVWSGARLGERLVIDFPVRLTSCLGGRTPQRAIGTPGTISSPHPVRRDLAIAARMSFSDLIQR